MGLIPNNFNILILKIFNRLYFSSELDFRKLSWLALKLLFQGFYVIDVNMRISQGMDELARFKTLKIYFLVELDWFFSELLFSS